MMQRTWNFPWKCDPCDNCPPTGQHTKLERMLRHSMANKLCIENDSFDSLFKSHPDISFRAHEKRPVEYYLSNKLILGVAPNMPGNENDTFVIPVMKGGKMWQLIFSHTIIDKKVWDSFGEAEPLTCLVCTDHPFDVYPCNFIVNESVCCIRSIVWPDHRRPHYNKREDRVVIYTAHSEKIVWPFLDTYFRDVPINHLGNMAVYTTGDIFVRIFKNALAHPHLLREKGMAIRRGEIDEAITQTRQLHKDRANRVGRFTKNVASNSFVNMCTAACGLQKVLPKDSKTTEPRTLSDSEVGFIDLLYTPDTPQRCGILLETVPDVIVSSESLCCDDPATLLATCLGTLLLPVTNPPPPSGHRLLLLVNHTQLYTTSKKVDFCHVQKALKQAVPCIELLQHGPRFWSCTSLSRMIYKMCDGLLYTPKEHHQASKGLLMGPSMMAIPTPNKVHLPRVSSACCAMRHYAGRSDNTRALGEIHQKSVLSTFYNFADGRLPIPGQQPLVCVANWHNPEDAITIKASSLDRGLFAGESVESITVTFSENGGSVSFAYTDFRGPLRGETVLARLLETTTTTTWSIHNYTYHGDVECRRRGGGVEIVWVGEEEEEEEMKKPSLTDKERNPAAYRCVRLEWNDNLNRFRVVVAAHFIPSLGDKLQTPTSQKGVLGHIIRSDADVPFLNTGQQSILPDIFINPHHIKRQAFVGDFSTQDADNNKEFCYMEDCFLFDEKRNVEVSLKWAEAHKSGYLMNPYTGHRMGRASVFHACYVLVTNHRASATMQASSSGPDTVRSDFTRAPVRGKRGALAIGPMEHAALADMQRIDTELTHMRSDYQRVKLDGGCTLSGSAALQRLMDDWYQANVTTSFCCSPI